MSDTEVRDRHKFRCWWCGKRRRVDWRRKGDHPWCAVRRRFAIHRKSSVDVIPMPRLRGRRASLCYCSVPSLAQSFHIVSCGIGQGMSAPRTNTRQFCHRCNTVDRIGFLAPKELWRLVAGPRWEHDILCLACFAEIGDEKGIEWDVAELEFYPVSYVTLDRDRVSDKEQ